MGFLAVTSWDLNNRHYSGVNFHEITYYRITSYGVNCCAEWDNLACETVSPAWVVGRYPMSLRLLTQFKVLLLVHLPLEASYDLQWVVGSFPVDGRRDHRWFLPILEVALFTSRVAHLRSGINTPLRNHMGYHHHHQEIPDIL